MSSISISVNGETQQVDAGSTIANLIQQMGFQSKFVAVERNRELVPRAEHHHCVLIQDDEVEVVTLVGGG